MRLTADTLPALGKMKLGEKHKVIAEIEPVDLSTGENEYGPMMNNDGKEMKEPMSGRFKIHSIEIHSPEDVANALDSKKKAKSKSTGRGKTGRY